MKKSLSYDDVLLLPQYSDIRSRKEVNTGVDLGNGLKLDFPVLASPMDTISEAPMAIALAGAGGAAIIHRYNSVQEQTKMVSWAREAGIRDFKTEINVGAAVGITGDFLLRSKMCIDAGATFICVDVAHGHHILMQEALSELRKEFGYGIHIMAGNVATIQGINDLSKWGANSVRCNIGGGSICSTRIETGHGVPGLQTIIDCAKTTRDVSIIADGGLRNSGDIVKSIAAGADAVMCGSLFSGTDEAPGKIIEENDGTRWKIYRGMASKEAQVDWRGKFASAEGISARVPYRGSVRKILESIDRGMRSGFSYSGCRTIAELQAKACFTLQTPAGMGESKTHILNRKW